MVPVAAKVGALLAVAAAGSTSVWYFSDSIFGTSLVSVADETDQTPYTDGSIGKKYGKYFLSSSSKNNKKIWEERYEKNKSKFEGPNTTNTKAKDKFGAVKEGYGDNATTSLNKVCEAVYKLTETSSVVDTDAADKYTTEHIWKFCGLRDIVTVEEDKTITYENTKIGGTDTEKKLFVSTKLEGNGNDWFWKLKTEEFWSGTPSLQGTDNTKNEFKKLKDDTTKKDANIKEACEEAYKKGTSDDTNNKNKEDALVFCSIKLTVGTSVGG